MLYFKWNKMNSLLDDNSCLAFINMSQCSYKAEEIIHAYLFFVLQIPYICKDLQLALSPQKGGGI